MYKEDKSADENLSIYGYPVPDVWKDAKVATTQVVGTHYYPGRHRDRPCLGFCTFTKTHQHVHFRPLHSAVEKCISMALKSCYKEADSEGEKLWIGATRQVRASSQKPKEIGLKQHREMGVAPWEGQDGCPVQKARAITPIWVCTFLPESLFSPSFPGIHINTCLLAGPV